MSGVITHNIRYPVPAFVTQTLVLWWSFLGSVSMVWFSQDNRNKSAGPNCLSFELSFGKIESVCNASLLGHCRTSIHETSSAKYCLAAPLLAALFALFWVWEFMLGKFSWSLRFAFKQQVEESSCVYCVFQICSDFTLIALVVIRVSVRDVFYFFYSVGTA